MELKIGNFFSKLKEDGTWLYKAATPSFFKKDGALKKKYHDMPRYRVIQVYEQAAKDQYQLELAKSVKDITDKLKTFVLEPQDLEKARGVKKLIGELDKSGKNIKTANGWVPVKQFNKRKKKEEVKTSKHAIHSKLLYHGSSKEDIKQFNPLENIRGLDAVGTWFTDSKRQAGEFAKHVKKVNGPEHPGRIYEARITIKNPWMLYGDEGFEEYLDAFTEATGLKAFMKPTKEDILKFRKYITDQGYDGMIIEGMREAAGANYYVAFSNDQIDMGDEKKEKPLKERLEEFMNGFRKAGYQNPFDPKEYIFMGSVGVELSIFDDAIHLSAIRSIEKGQGKASKVLKSITDYADELQVPITLEPVAFGDGDILSDKQLEDWYRRFGWKNRYEEGNAMIREPKNNA